jgi:hypothetical protein
MIELNQGKSKTAPPVKARGIALNHLKPPVKLPRVVIASINEPRIFKASLLDISITGAVLDEFLTELFTDPASLP